MQEEVIHDRPIGDGQTAQQLKSKINRIKKQDSDEEKLQDDPETARRDWLHMIEAMTNLITDEF